MAERLNSADTALRARAAKVIPGGMWGHLNAANLPEGYPQFFARAQGCRLWDVDGNEVVDFMCSWGPIVLGHHHPAVEEAVRAQAAQGATMNGPGAVLVDLAEQLTGMLPAADWCLFEKNGTDATTACVTIARAGTGRRKVLLARGSYHGAAPWCSPSLVGVTAEDRAHIIHYDYGDLESVRAALAEAGGDCAAVLASAFRHDMARALELPTRDYAQGLRALCDAAGAALILDDVRAGFRLHLGGSWEAYGVRPDFSAWSKAIANGYALSAVTGAEKWRAAAARVFTTGSFWAEATSMAASLATLRELQRVDGPALMAAMGERLRAGLSALATHYGVGISHSGPPQMPLMLFDDDADFAKGNAFCSAALRAGAYFHPKHNMFLSTAHGPADIDRGLEAAEAGFRAVSRM